MISLTCGVCDFYFLTLSLEFAQGAHKLVVHELEKKLKEFGLPTNGKKAVLVERLNAALLASAPAESKSEQGVGAVGGVGCGGGGRKQTPAKVGGLKMMLSATALSRNNAGLRNVFWRWNGTGIQT